MGWDELPYPVLRRVYAHLDAHDRVSWGAVCRGWEAAAGSSSCWGYVEIRVGLSDPGGRVHAMIASHSAWVTRVNLVWDCRQVNDYSAYYLKALLSAKVRLRAVTLTNAVHGHKWPERNKTLFLLAKLLRKQERLEELSLEGAWIRGNELCHQVKNAAGVGVRRLLLSGASRSPGPNLGRLLPLLPNLTVLSMDADAVTGAFVDALAASAPSLASLTITARLNLLHPLANNKWAVLAASHPKLRVHLEIYDRQHPVPRGADRVPPT